VKHDPAGGAVLRPRPGPDRRIAFHERQQFAVDGDELVVTNSLGKPVRFQLSGPERVSTIGYRLESPRPQEQGWRPSTHLVLISAAGDVVAYTQSDPTEDDDFYWPRDQVEGFARAAGLRFEIFAAGPQAGSAMLPAITRGSYSVERLDVARMLLSAIIVLSPFLVLAFVLRWLPLWVTTVAILAGPTALVLWMTRDLRRGGRTRRASRASRGRDG